MLGMPNFADIFSGEMHQQWYSRPINVINSLTSIDFCVFVCVEGGVTEDGVIPTSQLSCSTPPLLSSLSLIMILRTGGYVLFFGQRENLLTVFLLCQFIDLN